MDASYSYQHEAPPPSYDSLQSRTDPDGLPDLEFYPPASIAKTDSYIPLKPPSQPQAPAQNFYNYPVPGSNLGEKQQYIPPPPPPRPHPISSHQYSSSVSPEKINYLEHTQSAPFGKQPMEYSQYVPSAPSPNPPLPARPQMRPHMFSEPYIAPQHTPYQQAPNPHIHVTPQFQHPPQGPTYYPPPPSQYDRPGSMSSPVAPAYPQPHVHGQAPTSAQASSWSHNHRNSAPTLPVFQNQPEQRIGSIPLHETTSLPQPQGYISPGVHDMQSHEDEKKNNFGKRFVGNMLVTRAVRSSIQTVASTAQLPFYLSPWGDNNPVTLPNVRKRDIGFMGLAHFGADALAPSAMEAMGTVMEKVTLWTAEQVADETTAKLSGQKMPSITKTGAAVASFEVRVHHKLIGEEAVVSLSDERPAENHLSIHKGWFCPYLYATGRFLKLDRRTDFTAAKMHGPGLKADAELAPMILKYIGRVQPEQVIHLCDWQTPSVYRPKLGRIAIFFMGISPYRTTSVWNQARIPNQGRFRFHLFDGMKVIVLPALAKAPICMWHSKTFEQIWEEVDTNAGGSDKDAKAVVEKSLCDAVDTAGLHQHYQERLGLWQHTVEHTLTEMFDAVRLLRASRGTMGNLVDPGRTGLIMFRF